MVIWWNKSVQIKFFIYIFVVSNRKKWWRVTNKLLYKLLCLRMLTSVKWRTKITLKNIRVKSYGQISIFMNINIIILNFNIMTFKGFSLCDLLEEMIWVSWLFIKVLAPITLKFFFLRFFLFYCIVFRHISTYIPSPFSQQNVW